MKKCVVSSNGCENCQLNQDANVLYSEQEGYTQDVRDKWIEEQASKCIHRTEMGTVLKKLTREAK